MSKVKTIRLPPMKQVDVLKGTHTHENRDGITMECETPEIISEVCKFCLEHSPYIADECCLYFTIEERKQFCKNRNPSEF